MALEFIKLFKGDSPVSQVGSYGFFKLGVESGGGGGGGEFSTTFGDNDWNTIAQVSAEISANSMTSEQVAQTYGWNIGDTKSETLTTGEVIQLRIIGYNHDDKSDGSGKAGMTLQMNDCFETKYKFNSTRANAGGWGASKMRKTTLPTIKATLSQELQSNIKLVNKNSSQGTGTVVETVSDDLFLLSEIELFGVVSNAVDGVNEGNQYAYWQGKTSSDRIFATQERWWLRSSYYGDSRRVCNVYSGNTNSSFADNSYGLSFALCI